MLHPSPLVILLSLHLLCVNFFFSLAYKQVLVHKSAMINVPYSIILEPRPLRGSSPSSESNKPLAPTVTSPGFS